MKSEQLQISFRPVTVADFPVLRNWMKQSHWQEWWGDPEGELDDIRNMVEGKDTSRPFLFLTGGRPAGFIQYWFVGHHQNQSWIEGYPWLAELPREAIGVDLSIGDASDLSRGIGSKALLEFTKRLCALGYETIIIDPDPENLRAIKAYEKAGYKPMGGLAGKCDDVLIMRFEHPDERT